jgi:hypothetical protein
MPERHTILCVIPFLILGVHGCSRTTRDATKPAGPAVLQQLRSPCGCPFSISTWHRKPSRQRISSPTRTALKTKRRKVRAHSMSRRTAASRFLIRCGIARSYSMGEADLSASKPWSSPRTISGGTIARLFLAVPGATESEGLAVSWEGGPGGLASVQALQRDSDGTWYVALEVMEEDLDTVQKVIRKYARNGNMLAEIHGIPTDYCYAPVVDFRVRRGVVYQMEPLAGELRINAWNLTAFR